MKPIILAFFCVCFVLLTIATPIDRNVAVLEDATDNIHSDGQVQHFEQRGKTSRRGRVLQLSDYYDTQVKNVLTSGVGDVAPSGSNSEERINVDSDTLWLDSPDPHDSTNNRKTATSPVKRLPQAIIIGVKKGGTRALLEFLRIHPDVRAPGPEPHFFDRHYDKGLDWYREQMPSSLAGQITIEKTPCYFVTKEVPQRIFNMSKTIKLIVVVRDPVTRAISDYTQAATKRPGMKPFDQMAFIDNSSRIVDTKWAAVRIGVYAKHLERWLKYFPLSQIHFVNGEKLISDPAGEMAKVQDFLGLKRIVTDKHFYLNETRGFPCLKKPEGSGRPHCLGKTKGRQHPRVDLKVMHRLRDFFKPFNAKFYQITGQVFDWN